MSIDSWGSNHQCYYSAYLLLVKSGFGADFNRYVLSIGHCITANRKLVVSGKASQVHDIRTKHVIHRCTTAGATHRNETFNRGRLIKISGQAYSHPYSNMKPGALRYRISGGYVTASKTYVQVIK